MKRAAICVVIVILCTMNICAYAEDANYTIEEIREQSDLIWDFTYETKWRSVQVSIIPTLPDVQAMPVLKVRPAFWIPKAKGDVSWNAAGIHFDMGGDAFCLSEGDIYGEENSVVKGVKYESISDFVYAPFDIEEYYAPLNALTLKTIIEKLRSILTEINNLHFNIDTDHLLYVLISSKVSQKSNEPLLPSSISITVPITLRSIPIWGHVISSVDSHKDDELTYEPNLTFTIRSQTSYELIGTTVYETEEVVADIPLCSFDTVRNTIEQEIENGHIRAIYNVDLGYALYNTPGTSRKPGREWIETAEFYAVPTWRVVCLYSNQAKKDLPETAIENPATSLYFKIIYIHAQTGALIDPSDGARGCGDYQGIMTWTEVE